MDRVYPCNAVIHKETLAENHMCINQTSLYSTYNPTNLSQWEYDNKKLGCFSKSSFAQEL